MARHRLWIQIFALILLATVVVILLFSFVIPLQRYPDYPGETGMVLCNGINLSTGSYQPLPRGNYHILRGELDAYRQAQSFIGSHYAEVCGGGYIKLFL